jgi:hypothetical protein
VEDFPESMVNYTLVDNMPWFIKHSIGDGASTEHLAIGDMPHNKSQFYWTYYPYKAIQFYRKEDAERMLSAILYLILNYDQYYREDNIWVDDALET